MSEELHKQKANISEAIDLTSKSIKDHKQLAELWEFCMTGHADVAKNGMYAEFHETCWTKEAAGDRPLGELKLPDAFKMSLHGLGPDVEKFVSVNAIIYPVVVGYSRSNKECRWYETKNVQQSERMDMMPLGMNRTGFSNVWNDEEFPVDEAVKGKELPESCVLIDCPSCKGKGYKEVEKKDTVYKSVKCPRCLGSGMDHGGKLCIKCDGSGWVREGEWDISYEKKECKTCGGKKQVKSYLIAHRTPLAESGKTFLMICPGYKMGIPKLVKDAAPNLNCSKGFEYKVYKTIESEGCYKHLGDDDFPEFKGVDSAMAAGIKQLMIAEHEKYDDKKARYEWEKVKFCRCVRYVRFHFKFYTTSNDRWDDNAKCVEDKIKKNYWNDDKPRYIEQEIWFDTVTHRAYSAWANAKDDDLGGSNALIAVLWLLLNKAANKGKVLLVPTDKDNAKSSVKPNNPIARSKKKRWMFVLLGILLGLFGLHFLYARRKGWFFFYWLMILANVAQTKVPAMVDAIGTTPYFGLVAGLMLVGSIFFMKKDGDGNRM